MNTVAVVALLLIAQGHFAFPIVQQPKSDPWYVSQHPNEVTQYAKATNVTILAHDYLAGEEFYDLRVGDRLFLIGNGILNAYSIYAIDYYEAITLKLYKNLETGDMINVYDIITRYYHVTDLTLQTCISREGNNQWGLMFVVGKRIVLHYPLPK